jgi:hypothetical protein
VFATCRSERVGPIPTLQAGGRRFDPVWLHFREPRKRGAFRLLGFAKDVLNNPNVLLQAVTDAQEIDSTTTLVVETGNQPIPGGGQSNTAFLAGVDPTDQAGNASANLVQATFWIESVAAQGISPAFMQLQYTQTVMLDFNNLRWPHVTVATLRQRSTGPVPVFPAPPSIQF